LKSENEEGKKTKQLQENTKNCHALLSNTSTPEDKITEEAFDVVKMHIKIKGENLVKFIFFSSHWCGQKIVA
jgi:hypothetical protein